MKLSRVARHLTASHRQVRHLFPSVTMMAIEQAIAASEANHAGEIRFAVEAALEIGPLLDGQTARSRAIDVFSQLRIWDTEHRNGVLIYLLLADRDVEIVADRGIAQTVGGNEWELICREMERAFKKRDFEGGVLNGIKAVSRHLIHRYPADGDARNEVENAPVVL